MNVGQLLVGNPFQPPARGRAASPTTAPPLRFRSATRIAACRSIACLRMAWGLTGYQRVRNLPSRHRSADPPHDVHRAPKQRPALEPRIALVAALRDDGGKYFVVDQRE